MINAPPSMENLCRSCMSECENMKNLFTLRECNEDNLKLADMLMACASVKIDENEGLPVEICGQCEVKLCLAYDFRTLCEKTEITLRKLLQDTKQIINFNVSDYVVKCNDSDEFGCENQSEYICKTCDVHLGTKRDYVNHMRKHTKQEEDTGNGKESIDVTNQKNQFDCKHCGKVLRTEVGLKVHIRRHTGLNLHTCGVCDKTYAKESHFKRHQLLHDNKVEEPESIVNVAKKKDRTMECEFCDRVFKYKKSFAHHLQVEHGVVDDGETSKSPSNVYDETDETAAEDGKETIIITPEIQGIERERIHVCHVCEATFTRSNHLTRHMTLHRTLLIHKCDRCEKSYATTDHLKRHVQDDHVAKAYDCSVCKKGFTRGEHLIRHLKVHLKSSDEQKNNVKCSVCSKEFTRLDQFTRHLKVHLQQDKRYACNVCGKAFTRLDNLKTHQRIHTGEKKENGKLHLCIYCGKEFNNSSNMIVHMRRHTGERPYKCTQCGKGFPRSHDLKCHERTHSGERPYLCTLCGKSFNKSNKLLRHTRIHTGERPYVCNLCGRAFTQSNDLALHLRRHTGSRPYACGVCPARFIQSGQLKAHRRSTGHWMETQPDLKGGHRVEPVVPLSDPAPIKFKTYGKTKKNAVVKPETVSTVDSSTTVTNETTINEQQQPSLIVTDDDRMLTGYDDDDAGFVANVEQRDDVLRIKCESETTDNGRNGFQTAASFPHHPEAFHYETY